MPLLNDYRERFGEGPEWFHLLGVYMDLETVKPAKGLLVLASSSDYDRTARISVCPARLGPRGGQIWEIRWAIVDGPLRINGAVELTERQLRTAFGLSRKHNASQIQRFVREGRFLNIPTYGSSESGDPTLSIFLSDQIKKAIRDLIDWAAWRRNPVYTTARVIRVTYHFGRKVVDVWDCPYDHQHMEEKGCQVLRIRFSDLSKIK